MHRLRRGGQHRLVEAGVWLDLNSVTRFGAVPNVTVTSRSSPSGSICSL